MKTDFSELWDETWGVSHRVRGVSGHTRSVWCGHRVPPPERGDAGHTQTQTPEPVE